MTAVPPSTAGVPGTLPRACGPHPGVACRLVWDLTHNSHAATVTDAYLAGPVRVALHIAFILVLALIVRAITHRTISRIARRAAEAGFPGRSDLAQSAQPARGGRWRRGADAQAAQSARGERRRQRAEALASILRNASSVVIFGIAGVTIAGDLGVNLAPVLASAGVLGIAIGFGAQSLVKDFISGIFMLLEDQYGVGDFIDVGDAEGSSATNVTGTVEAVSLRTTRLRDLNGVVWHVRNGTIARIGNQSQGWSRAVIDFPVRYQEDLERIRSLMKEAAAGLWREPRWNAVILEEPEVWGVESVYTYSVVMRVVAKTAPMRHLEVARALRERLKAVLDREGIGTEPAIAAPGPADPAGVSADPPEISGPAGPVDPATVSGPTAPERAARAPAPRKASGRGAPRNAGGTAGRRGGDRAPRTLDSSHERDD